MPPRKVIDMNLLEKLALIQCTDGEISAVLGISVDTLSDREKDTPAFADIIKKGRLEGRKSLRRAQWAVALGDKENKPNPTMLIWLGKQYLGQTDKQEVADLREERVMSWLKEVTVVKKQRNSKHEPDENTVH